MSAGVPFFSKWQPLKAFFALEIFKSLGYPDALYFLLSAIAWEDDWRWILKSWHYQFDKNLKIYTVWYFEKETRSDIETWSIDRVLSKEHLYEKSMQKMCTKRC